MEFRSFPCLIVFSTRCFRTEIEIKRKMCLSKRIHTYTTTLSQPEAMRGAEKKTIKKKQASTIVCKSFADHLEYCRMLELNTDCK